MLLLMAVMAALLARDEAALRDAFAKEIKAKDAKKRVEAVKKLAGAKEEKTVELLAHSLKDPELDVRKAAAETLEVATDGAGVALDPLGEILMDKKADLDLRVLCAKALVKSSYKEKACNALIKTISAIENTERQFHKFGFEVTGMLDKFAGKSFGAAKETPERWGEWWTDNKERLHKEDEKTREEWKKDKK
jgi:hypothetical protein